MKGLDICAWERVHVCVKLCLKILIMHLCVLLISFLNLDFCTLKLFTRILMIYFIVRLAILALLKQVRLQSSKQARMR